MGISLGVAPAALPPTGAPLDPAAIIANAAASSSCGVIAGDLAGIRMVESGGAVVLQPNGRVTYEDGSLIVGPALDGSGVGGNTEAWWDEDGGRYDGDTVFERGVGPFGMMPTTWIGLGEPGDPHNLADAAAGAARLLCEAKGYDPTDPVKRRTAIRSYNGTGPNAEWYADEVLSLSGGFDLPAGVATASGNPTAAPQSSDGFAGRVVDRGFRRLFDGWRTLGAKVTGSKDQRAVKLWGLADRQVSALDDPAGYRSGIESPDSMPTASPGRVLCPVDEPEQGDGWGVPRSGGRTHQGIDIGAPDGAPVRSPLDGVVTDTVTNEADGGMGGLSVTVRFGNGDEVYLAHLSAVDVRPGQEVRAGEQVGRNGSTGNASSDDPHVHLQFYPGGGAVAPAEPFLGTACAATRKVTP